MYTIKKNRNKTRLIIESDGFSTYYNALIAGEWRNRIVSIPIPSDWDTLAPDQQQAVGGAAMYQSECTWCRPSSLRIVRKGYRIV